MPFTKSRTGRRTFKRRFPYKRKTQLTRHRFRNPGYFFTRWDNTINYQWYIERRGYPAWETQTDPGVGGGNIYILKCVRPDIAIANLVSSSEFTQLFRWYKILKTETTINFSWSEVPEALWQKTGGVVPPGSDPALIAGRVATYAPPTNQPSTVFGDFKPAKYFRVFTWIDKTNKEYSDTAGGQLAVAKQIASMKMFTARKQIKIITRPQGIVVTQIGEQVNQDRPAQQAHRRSWMTCDYPNMLHFGPVFGVQPVCPVVETFARQWGVDISVDTKYYLQFKGTR